jgi:predicted deacylase
VRDGEADHPVLAIRSRGSSARNKILVVAGIHGNETAGLHAVPAILDFLEADRPEYRSSEVTIVAPANPVGVLHGSRYNGDGCDLNRDFHDPRTHEARMIHDFIAAQRPDLIVSLHEGPQDGYLLVVTSEGSKQLAEAAVRAVRERGFALASSHFAGFALGTLGLSAEGSGTDFLKWALRLHTLGSFAASLGIGTYTTETSWSSRDFEGRVQAHVVTVEALLLASARDGEFEAQ